MARQPSVVLDERAVQRENALLRELVTVYQHLTGLTLQDADVSTVLQLLATRTAATVAVVSRGLEVLAAAGPDLSDDQVAGNVREYVAARRLGTVLNSTAQTRRSLRLPDTADSAGVIVAPILVGDDVPAYLLTFSKADADGSDMSLLVTEHAATICGVILGRERVVAAAARQVRDDLVEGLLLGTSHGNGEVGRWARHLGYDASREHRILAVAIEATGSAGASGSAAALWKRVAAAIDHFFASRTPGAIIAIREGEVVIVLPDPDGLAGSSARAGTSGLSGGSAPRVSTAGGVGGSSPRANTAGGVGRSSPRANTAGGAGGLAPRVSTTGGSGRVSTAGNPGRSGAAPGVEAIRLSTACLARMRDLFPEAVVTIGIGGSCRDPAEIARSYGQARRTIDAVVRLGRQGQAVAFDDLGIHRLLLQVPDLAELRSFASEILGELDRQDPQRGAELLATLACYFRENNSPQRTAQSLHVHPNTVAYRIRRVQEITGLRLDTYRDRLMAQVAIEIVAATEGGMDVLHGPERMPR